VVGIGDHLRINGTDELGMPIDMEAYTPLPKGAGIGL
jgi:hypothetical protein